MALFNIPQFIGKEDKIAGPFTAKQLGWIFSAGGTLFVLYVVFGRTTLFILTLPVLIIFGGLAFYRPHGQPLTTLLTSIVRFFFNPKLYIWRRLPEEMRQIKKAVSKKTESAPQKKMITENKIEEISKLLDNSK